MVNVSEWDILDYLETDQDVIDYLKVIAQENDIAFLQAAIGDIARRRGMSKIALETGLGRESLYKSLSADGHPSAENLNKVLNALGARLSIEPLAPATA